MFPLCDRRVARSCNLSSIKMEVDGIDWFMRSGQLLINVLLSRQFKYEWNSSGLPMGQSKNNLTGPNYEAVLRVY